MIFHGYLSLPEGNDMPNVYLMISIYIDLHGHGKNMTTLGLHV